MKKLKFRTGGTNEVEMRLWLRRNYKKLEFDRITGNLRPDIIARKENREIRVELETKSSNFIKHGHPENYADLVLCVEKDCDLPIPIIEIPEIKDMETKDILILRFFDEPRTSWDVAKEFSSGRPPYSDEHYYINKLEKLGLISVVKIKPWHLGDVKYYLITAKGRAILRGFKEAERRE